MLGDDTPATPAAPIPKATPAPKSAAKPPAKPPAPGILDRIGNALKGEELFAGKVAGGIGSALQFPQQKVAGAITSGHPLAKSDPMRALRERVSGALGDPGFEQRYESYPQPVRGLLDFGMQTVTDPLAFLGAPVAGRSMLARGTEALEAHGLPLAVKAGQAIAKVPGGSAVTDKLAQAHNYLGVHSAAKRELARQFGASGKTITLPTAAAAATHSLRRVETEAPAKDYTAEFLSHTNRSGPVKRYDYFEGDKPVGHVEVSFPQSSGVPHIEDLFTQPGKRKQGIGEAMLRDTTETLRGLGFKKVTASPVNEASAHINERVWGPGERSTLNSGEHGRGADAVAINDIHSLLPPPGQTVKLPGWLDQYAQARARIGAAKAAEQQGLKVTPKVDPQILKLMTKSEHYDPSPLTRISQVPQDFFTAGLFALPFGHMANISALGALADPGAVAKALARGTGENARLVGGALRGKAGETYDALAAENLARHTPAIRGGAIGSHPERVNPLDTGLGMAANAAQKVPLVGQALALIPKAARGLYRASGDVLWKFDDEVKAQRFQRLVDGGMNPERAGLRVGGELVDYENKSPVARNLRPLAPFSTWRTKAPLATGRNIAENPGRAAAISRGVPAALGGSQGSDKDTGKPFTSSLPGAELNTLLTNPAKYAMSSFGAAPRLTLDLAGAIAGGSRPQNTVRQARDAKKLRTFMTYGQEPGTFALNELPLYGQALQLSGHGMFQHDQQPDWLTNLLSQLRVHP